MLGTGTCIELTSETVSHCEARILLSSIQVSPETNSMKNKHKFQICRGREGSLLRKSSRKQRRETFLHSSLPVRNYSSSKAPGIWGRKIGDVGYLILIFKPFEELFRPSFCVEMFFCLELIRRYQLFMRRRKFHA